MTTRQIPLPEKLVPVFEGEASVDGGLNVRGAFGGRGSAKTRSFATMAAVWGMKFAEAGIEGQIVCAREFQNSLEDSSMAEVKLAIQATPWLAAYYEIGKKYIRSRNGRVYFNFMGLRHNIASLKGLARILVCWPDEAENVSEASWRTLIPTLREEGAELWPTWNPADQRSATHIRFRKNPPPGAKIVEMNWRDNPWFTNVLDSTRRHDKEKHPDTYDHVWEGDFLLITEGAYFGREMRKVRAENRITRIPVESHAPTFTFWDLGYADDTAIWVMQAVGKELRMVGFYRNHGMDLGHYIDWVEDFGREHNVRRWEKHFGPHDIEVHELQSGKSRKEWAKTERGFEFETVKRPQVKQDGIDASRRILPYVIFDETRCEDGVEAMEGYRREFDEDRQVFRPKPLHNWASNPADAFQTFALAWEDKLANRKSEAEKAAEAAAARGHGQGGWMG